MLVEIDPVSAAAFRRHARAAFPREACGLLGRETGTATIQLAGYQPMANLAAAAHRFAMDPVAVARCEHSLRVAGRELGAVFHSHPGQPATPSEADRAAAWPGLVQLILSLDSGPANTADGPAAEGVPEALTAWVHRGGCLRRVEWTNERCLP